MDDNITFREAPAPDIRQDIPIDTPEPDKRHVASGESENEPVEIRDTGGRSVVLDVLWINDTLNNLPEEDKNNVSEVKNYILGIIQAKGVNPTVSVFKDTLDSIKGEMGLSNEAEPSKVLDRIAGVVKAWRNISFIKDPQEKKRIFFKLAKLNSSAEMNREVYKIMEDYEVWQ
jgi:hypothetical protein